MTTGSLVPSPKISQVSSSQEHEEGPKDTPPEIALKKTYDYNADKDAMRLARLTMTKFNYR
eukprot:Skav235220  [mRNA]  locus=scaffold3995:118446:118628:+ [translate_table: standard]